MKYYTGLITKMCPMCGRTAYLKISEDRQKECDAYNNGDSASRSIQSALPSFDKFEREFIKTGYCPVCQKKIFAAKLPAKNEFTSLDPEVNQDNIRGDVVDAFLSNPLLESYQKRKDWIGAIQSECGQELTVSEKLLYLAEFDLIGRYKVSADGVIVPR